MSQFPCPVNVFYPTLNPLVEAGEAGSIGLLVVIDTKHPRHQRFQDWQVMAHTARKRINIFPKKLSLHRISRVTSYSNT